MAAVGSLGGSGVFPAGLTAQLPNCAFRGLAASWPVLLGRAIPKALKLPSAAARTDAFQDPNIDIPTSTILLLLLVYRSLSRNLFPSALLGVRSCRQ